MTEWTLHEETLDVPKGTGKEGFLKTIGTLLDLPRLQEVHIDARGTIRHARFVPQGEVTRPVTIDFDGLMPYAIVRAGTVVEIPIATGNAAVALAAAFDAVARDALSPVAWVTGASSTVWRWFERTTAVVLTPSSLFGLPVYSDRHVEDDVLLLAAAYGRGATFAQTQKTYTIAIPEESHDV